jgi:hypothetical protein
MSKTICKTSRSFKVKYNAYSTKHSNDKMNYAKYVVDTQHAYGKTKHINARKRRKKLIHSSRLYRI